MGSNAATLWLTSSRLARQRRNGSLPGSERRAKQPNKAAVGIATTQRLFSVIAQQLWIVLVSDRARACRRRVRRVPRRSAPRAAVLWERGASRADARARGTRAGRAARR